MNNSKPTTLVILAAGMGSRYGGLKQLDSVGPMGETILDYSVYDAIEAGFTKVVFIIRKDFSDIFKEKIVSKYKNNIKVECVFQELSDLPKGYLLPDGREKPWGTAHALLCAKDVVNEAFCVINADDFYSRDAFREAHKYLISDDLGFNTGKNVLNIAMVGYQLNNTLSDNGSVARGVCELGDEDKLIKIEELLKIFKVEGGAENHLDNGEIRKLTGSEVVSMNMWCLHPEIFKYFQDNFTLWLDVNINVEKSEYLLPVEIDKLIQKGRAQVKVLKTYAKWFGVTYKEDKAVVVDSIKNLVSQGIYPERLY